MLDKFNSRFILFALIIIGVMPFSSCIFRKLTYVDDMKPYENYPVMNNGEIKIQKEDKLSITVGSKNPELATPFNVGAGGYSVAGNGALSVGSTAGSSPHEKGYIVDQEGNIDFPVLGSLHVEGKTQSEIENMIKQILIDKKLISDPTVNADLLNLKIIVLGEAGVGIQSYDSRNVNILEVLAKAGGGNENSKLKEVKVIRTTNGVRKMYLVDLHSVALFDSPVYYLKQNDVVFIQPYSGKMTQGFSNIMTIASTGMGVFNILLSLLILQKR